MSAYAVLGEAHRLIFNPAAWATNALARDVQGRPVDPNSPDAVRWDALGAVRRATYLGRYSFEVYDRAVTLLQDAMGGPVTQIQDACTHAQVIEFFEKARMEAIHEAGSNASAG